MKNITKISGSLAAVALVAVAATSNQGLGPRAADSAWKEIVIDVACDCRTGGENYSPGDTGPQRGSTFIINGRIFPGGSITSDDFNPDTAPGLLGTWVCKGTYNVSGDQVAPGFGPHSDSTQLYLFNGAFPNLGGEDTLMSAGEEGALVWETPTHRVVLGGTGIYRGVVGEVKEEGLGFNSTGCPNIRFTFKVRN